MIVFFGPAGAGKSTQGQILSVTYGWPLFSAGQLLRDMHDNNLLETMRTGKLVPPEKVNQLMGDALSQNSGASNVILDGFPRQLVQAHWLIDNQHSYGRSIDLVIVLDIPKPELMRRLEARGRVDDIPEVISERLKIYYQEISSILDLFTRLGIKIIHIDGSRQKDEVNKEIMKEIMKCKLV